MLGYFLAVISSIFFSLYVIPRKLTKIDPLYFCFLMGLGFFAGSVGLWLFQPVLGFHEILSPALFWSVLAGIIWATGFVHLVKSIDTIGLARSNQWKNLQGPIAVLLALVVLSEYASTNPTFALLAGLTIFGSALLLNVSDTRDRPGHRRLGIYQAAVAALAFGIVAVINKYVTVTVGVYSQQIVWSFGIAATMFVYLAHQQKLAGLAQLKTRDISLGLTAGLLYLGASFFMLQSFRFAPVAIAFTIIQLNTLWTLALGILIFKEVHLNRHYRRIILGTILAVLGIIFLAFAHK